MRVLKVATAVALVCAIASTGLAAEAKTVKRPAKPPAAVKADAPTPAQLRAKMHRTMAALIEAQAAEKPDAEKIKKLTAELGAIRAQMWEQSPAAPSGRPGPGWCPRGGPGMGLGPAWGGPGRGPGRGAGWGRGAGYGRGGRSAMGPGRGRGPGAGPGPGAGRGFGPAGPRGPAFGPGGGPGPGFGPGPARGPGFGPGPARGPGFGPGPRRGGGGPGPGPGWGAGPGRGLGPGRAFIDEDQDGVCDYFQQAQGDKP